jgi:hypothetical protein
VLTIGFARRIATYKRLNLLVVGRRFRRFTFITATKSCCSCSRGGRGFANEPA